MRTLFAPVVATLAVLAAASSARADLFSFVVQDRSVRGAVYYTGDLMDSGSAAAPDFGPFNADVSPSSPGIAAVGHATQASTLDPVSGIDAYLEIYASGHTNFSAAGEANSHFDVSFDLAAPITLYVDSYSAYAAAFSITGPGVSFTHPVNGTWFAPIPIEFSAGRYRVLSDLNGFSSQSTPPLIRLIQFRLSPLRLNPAAPQSAPAGASCQAPIPDFASASSADSSCGAVTITQSPLPGTLVGKGNTTITLTATCASGASIAATTTFTVTDSTPPVITACAPNQIVAAGPADTAPVPNFAAAATASDACGTITRSQSPAAGTPASIGPHTVTITINDAANLTSACNATLNVTPACPGDTNADGVINTADLTVMLAFYGQPTAAYPRADTNGSGQINTADLTILLARFGQSCP